MLGEPPPPNSGRDRAIETLIDSEPHGGFYRAARTLDEAVPYALSNRPNLVTRSALVEQANALAENEIDTLEKFANVFSSSSHRSPSISTPDHSNEDKERVLRHHAKMVKVQRVHGSGTATLAAAPPPQLVAALRRIYTDDDRKEAASRGALLRTLLRQVTSHKAFSRESSDEAKIGKNDAEEDAVDHMSSGELNEENIADEDLPAANLESIIGNVCRVAVAESVLPGSKDDSESLHGLLIAAMSVLTASLLEDEEEISNKKQDEPKMKIVDGHKMATAGTSSQVDSLKPMMPALQVGGVLSLLSSVDDKSDKNMFTLDADILSYFGKAAAVYEERIEIQKSRVLAQLKAESEQEAAAKETDAMAEQEENAQADIDAIDIPLAPVTPPSGNASGQGSSERASFRRAAAADVAIVEADDDEAEAVIDGVARVSEEGVQAPSDEAAANVGEENRVVSEVSGDESSDDDPDEATLSLLRQDSSDGDNTNNSGDDVRSASSAGYDDAQESDNPQSALLSDAHDDDVEIHADDDVSSSSSSSSDDEDDDVVDEDAMLVEDDEVESDEDEEDDMLRQALALSLAEHSSAFRNQDSGAAQDADEEGGQNRVAQGELNVDEEGKMPPLQKNASMPLTMQEGVESAEDENDSSLPAFPEAPSHYPYQSWLRPVDHDRADFADEENAARAGGEDSSFTSYLEPSALSKFGTLPAAHVVVQLLLNAVREVQGRKGFKLKETKEGDEEAPCDGCPRNSVPGGVGSSLFVPRPFSYNLDSSRNDEKLENSSDDSVSVQLLVAAFVLFSESRSHAVESLRQAILLEHQSSSNSDMEEELKEDEDGGSSPTSDEEDDPAIALAMNYASSPTHASSTISESLEAKGMTRKAAAAAHDAAILVKSLRKRTEAWKQRVQFYSHCTFMVMRCMRMYLESVTREWLNSRTKTEGDLYCLSLVDCAEFLPSTVRLKLSDTLTSLMSVSSSHSISTLFTNDNANEVEELLLPLKLYCEAVLTWGECIPLLYPSPASRTTVLTSLINESCPDSEEEYEALENLKSLPSSEWHPQLHRLHLLCQRLRVSDLLDTFVSHPVSYDPDDSVEAHEIVKLRNEGGRSITEDPDRASTLVSLLGSACEKVKLGEVAEMRKLYLALCHKCNVRALLWDGFLSCSGDDSDDRLASSVASPSLASSDILGVASNPSSSLQFDASKCSDSIAILSNHRNSTASSNGASAHQRASKVWGTVLSSSHFNPKTGVHRWAVRLDRCERGHVFVGVATSQASMRTYVGGDKYGWGVIGTQALWHDRRKIRGDYGATFRTGSTIVVTMDTDAGTLSFSSWKDSNSSNASFSLDALLPSLASPSPVRRHSTGGGGIVEDWGVAFEGLPLDSRLYPAVGLYQRDDRVTLLTVESGGRSALREGAVDGMLTGGACYFPRNLKSLGGGIDGVSHHRRIVHVRRHNDLLSWDGVQYVTDAVHQLLQSLQSLDGADEALLNSVIPSIAASLCLVPTSIPVLSARFALAVLPQLNRCIRTLDARLVSKNQKNEHLFPKCLTDGKWIIRATGSSGTASSECEEYVVDLSRIASADDEGGFSGTGVGTTGKSKNGLVSMMGTVRGSAMCFIEEWTDGTESSFAEDTSSSCVIAARLSLDGSKFEGSYRNVQFGTTGHISGMLCTESQNSSRLAAKVPDGAGTARSHLITCEALLCLAHGHLAGILGADSAGDHVQGTEASQPESYSLSDWKEKRCSLRSCLLSPLLRQKMLPLDGVEILDSIREYYSFPLHGGASIARGDYRALDTVDAMLSSVPLGQQDFPGLLDPLKAVGLVDEELTSRTGGKGSLCSICPSEYTSSRRRIISALICHSQLTESFILNSTENRAAETPSDVLTLWRAALRIMENGMRNALASPRTTEQTRREVAIAYCSLTDQISSFLFKAQLGSSDLSISGLIEEFSTFYSVVGCEADLEYLEREIERSAKRALLRSVSLQQTNFLLSRNGNSVNKGIQIGVAVECCTLALPRLIGRGLAEPVIASGNSRDISDWDRLCNDDLGGYYLTNLSASGHMSQHVRRTVYALFRSLGELLGEAVQEEKTGSSFDSTYSSSSLILSLLATFTVTFRSTDVEEMIIGSGILHNLQKIISERRAEIRTKHFILEAGDDCDEVSVVRQIHETVGRDISRAILRASVSVAHVVSFQLARQSSMPSRIDQDSDDKVELALQLCVNLLLGELAQTIPLVRVIMREELDDHRKAQVDEQWEKWCAFCLPLEASRAPIRKQTREGKTGLAYLVDNGTLPSSAGTSVSSHVPSARPSAAVSSSGVANSELCLNLLGSSCHQYVSQWLHILFGMVKYSASLSRVSDSKGWMDVLLPAVGLDCVFDTEKHICDFSLRQGKSISHIPLRYRVRVLKLLFSLLTNTPPNQKLVEGLFTLCGSSTTVVCNNIDDDENFVSREVTSLLRRLYALPHGAWRACIHSVIRGGLASSTGNGDSSGLKMGILTFFSGSIGKICRGSYVLLKPAAAAPLSADVLSSSSGKSHGSSGGSGSSSGSGAAPHLAVGSGTEGVVAGLCRADASAGIVSSVDLKSGTCEIVLTTRRAVSSLDSSILSQAPLRARSTEGGEGAVSSARYTMTVRALRAPLSDIVAAEEVPLLLGEDLPLHAVLHSRLPSAINSLAETLRETEIRSSGFEEKEAEVDTESDSQPHIKEITKTPCGHGQENHGMDKSKLVNLCVSLTTLRSAITVMADERLLANFVSDPSAVSTLSEVLKLASWEQGDKSSLPKTVECARMENLSSLPDREARHSHLLSMLRELRVRKELLDSTPVSYWEQRMAELVPDKKDTDVTEDCMSGVSNTSGAKQGYSTPPATTESTSVPPPPLATSSAGDDGDSGSNDRVNVSSSQPGVSRSAGRSNTTEEDEDADSTAAAHLREAAIAQMAELGLPRLWSELALRRTGGTNIEAAVHFCLERGGDMDRLLAEERERERMMQRQSSGSSGSRRRSDRGDSGSSNQPLRQLLEMGFPDRWCAEALAATRNNVDEALTWILTNGERLSAEDEGMDEDDDGGSESGDDEDSGDEEVDADEDTAGSIDGTSAGAETEVQSLSNADDPPKDDAPKVKKASNDTVDSETEHGVASPRGWTGSVTPLRFISGRSIINPTTLEISGLPSGGFSSVGTKGVMLTSGKWYYEAILETAGCLQIGWADGSFSGHCHADRGDGCGDGPSSWAYDGWRRYRWHACATEWGCRWKEGDIVGCLVDMDNHKVSFTLNGRGEEIGMGVAFTDKGFRPCGGVYACVSFNRREKLRLILGGKGSQPFQHEPPPGYRGVGEAVLEAVDELDLVLQRESVLEPEKLSVRMTDAKGKDSETRRFLCDFSDGEHGHELFAWQHRYYGSDASVHLGAGRGPKQSPSGRKHAGSSGSNLDSTAAACVSRRLEKLWSRIKSDVKKSAGAESSGDADVVISKVKQSYEEASQKICADLLHECLALGILYSRKLILHLMVSMGSQFDISYFVSRVDYGDHENEELRAARLLWGVLDVCISLRSAGWVGEAGAMAVAAEALGLGISSTENSHFRHQSLDIGSTSDSGDDLFMSGGGISQLLSTTLISDTDNSEFKDTANSLAACAEAAIGGGGGGGPLVFLQRSLQSAVCRSDSLQRILIAVVRRSVRLLAVVDYAGSDSAATDNLEDEDIDSLVSPNDRNSRFKDVSEEHSFKDESMLPDARLACFLTGLLLSRPVQETLSNPSAVKIPLFEAWSIGLLSASSPWRMVCALTSSAILNECPVALSRAVGSIPTLAQYFSRLESTVVRRVWAERAATPVCSRYVQSLIELLSSVKLAVHASPPKCPLFSKLAVDASTPLPLEVTRNTFTSKADPADSLPASWEWEEGWVASDAGWELWSGTVECMAVEWKTPSRSGVRTLMDGGEGPPMLREGCHVIRGLDWDETGSEARTGKEDGKDTYEAEKAKKEREKRILEEQEKQVDPAASSSDQADLTSDAIPGSGDDPVEDNTESPTTSSPAAGDAVANILDSKAAKEGPSGKKKKTKKIPSPKLPIGTVLAIESWNGIPAMARRVRWHLTGVEGTYRYGGDGGRYDISHVEVNEKSTRVRKRHPLPESAEQCASRHGFGVSRKYGVLLRIRRHGSPTNVDGEIDFYHQGILEWPDFGAGIRVDCILHSDGAVTVKERELLFGSKDSGWEARFGQPSYKPGTVMVLSPTGTSKPANQADLDARSAHLSFYEELLGSTCFTVENLRNRADGSKLRVTSEMKLLRARRPNNIPTVPSTPETTSVQAPLPPPICFDHDFKASSLSLSRDGRTVTCVSPDGRSTAFASVGFTKGVHYWEVKLEQADIGSVFIGVAEKPSGAIGSGGGGSSFGEVQPRLNRWHGWGFVNFRATYTAGAERVYGAHCHNSDTVGVLLDCDAGRVSFFCDHLKYGEHILNDLGCAFENISPFGFNADGCGSGGAGQGAPSGVEGGRGGRYPAQGSVRPRALWPVIGLRTPGDRVTISSKWMSSYGVDGVSVLKNVLAVDEILRKYDQTRRKSSTKIPAQSLIQAKDDVLPKWFIEEAFSEYSRWHDGKWYRSSTRGSGPYRLSSFGLDVDLDTSPLACASACAALGLKHALLTGDRVKVARSAGRMLELAEEAVVLGAYQGRLFYRIVAQKSEGGSLTEGGGRAWFWDESEVVDNGLKLLETGKGLGLELPLLDRFKCTATGGLKIVYEGGAVVRSDLEIFDGSQTIGSIPVGTVLPQKDVLERRVNSCGVVRYRIRFEAVGEGWISSRIRGGKEEAIVMPVRSDDASVCDPVEQFLTPQDSAVAWYKEYKKESEEHGITGYSALDRQDWTIKDVEEFEELLSQGVISGLSAVRSDEMISSVVTAIADFSEGGDAVDCSFNDIVGALSFAVASQNGNLLEESGAPGANQAAAAAFSTLNVRVPSTKALLARIAMLRAFNRRARYALPWLSIRPSHEGSAILGGLRGHGASIERAGRRVNAGSIDTWFHPSCIGARVRLFRNLFFRSVKRTLMDSITEATTTPTPLSHDEYELPREIRTVRINRLKAIRAMSGNDNAAKRKHGVFSQLQNETRSWGGAALRRGFVAKGHGGQKRAFKVKLIGEGVNDYSGPYREAFTDAALEVSIVNDDGHGALGVLEPTPNNASDIGENRELFMFASGGRAAYGRDREMATVSDEEVRILESFASLTSAIDESSREVEEALLFLGRMSGTACRHGIPVDLPLPLNATWRALCEEPIDCSARLREIDLIAWRQLEDDNDKNMSPLLLWQQRMLNSFVEGLSNVLPVEIFPLFTGEELRDMICGNPDVDVDLLHRVVEYEGYNESDDVIKYFWEVLREMSSSERKRFLQFVWARTRLPMKESDFDAPFKIQKDSANVGMDADVALPSASTCFFSLTLPNYSGKAVLKEKLLFAIENVCTMESDYVTNDAEVSEGWRGL